LTGEYPARLFDHPDIRRMLMLMKAKIEAGRAICLATAVASDLAQAAGDASAREWARLREELLTPIAKSWSTDVGVEVASLALQVHGGMGYIEETGVAQHYRDARIAPIYEGTNGIQAIDLAGRKLGLGNGEAMHKLLAETADAVGMLHASGNDRLIAIANRLDAARTATEEATDWLASRRGEPGVLAGATAYLELSGDLAGGWLLAKGALAATRRLANGSENAWLKGRVMLALFFGEHVLARAPGILSAVIAGVGDLSSFSPEAFGA
jgi:hypothetical protein